MCNRIDSTTELLKRMFLNCAASNETIMRYSDNRHDTKMCNKCNLIEEGDNYSIFVFEFDAEVLQYKFEINKIPLGGIQRITNITFIGFNE